MTDNEIAPKMISCAIAAALIGLFLWVIIGIPIQGEKRMNRKALHELHVACLQGGGEWINSRCRKDHTDD